MQRRMESKSKGVFKLKSAAIGLGLSLGWMAGDGLMTPCALAQQVVDPVRSERVFGANMHRFYDGQFNELLQELDAFISDDLEDPRIFYLRGLAQAKTGLTEAAAASVRRGAELEALQFGKRNYNIARALQRIQGDDRAMIENARAEALQRRGDLRAANAGIPRSEILAQMGRSILDPPPTPPASLPNLPDPATLSDATAPFGEGWEAAAPPPRRTAPPRATQPATADAFAEPPADKPADDPFAAPARDGDDPFAAPARGGDDPFATPARGGDDPFDPAPQPNNSAGNPAGGNAAAGGRPVNMQNVNGGKVLGKFFGALTAPLRKAVEQGAGAVQGLPGVGGGFPGGAPGGDFPPGSDFPQGGDFPPGGDLPPGFDPGSFQFGDRE